MYSLACSDGRLGTMLSVEGAVPPRVTDELLTDLTDLPLTGEELLAE
jgi:hypothetical protein